MIEPSLQLGGGNWANKSDSLLGYHKDGANFYADELTFSRNSLASYTDANGLIQSMPYNLLEQSNAFSTSPWSKSAGTTLTSGQADPNGGTTAFRMQMSSASNYLASGIYAVTSGAIYTYTIYIKSNTGGNQSFRLLDGVRGASGGVLNGTATTSWQRFELQITTNSTSGAVQLDNAGASYSNDLLICFTQANIGSTALPYFATTTRLNLARVDYKDNINGSLLLESQRTNLVTYSEDFSNAAWVKLNGSVTANNGVSPDGTSNADSFIPNTTSGIHALRSNILNQSATASHSWFLKANGYSKIAVRESELVGNYATFNLTTGTVISTNQTANIENYGNGWYRCTLVDTTIGTFAQTSVVVLPDSYTSGDPIVVNWSGDGIKGVFAWGASVEIGNYKSSYIKSEGAATTRLADAALTLSTTQTLTNFTLFWDGLIFENGNNMFFGSGSSAWYIDIDGSTSRVVLDLASGRIYSGFGAGIIANQRFKLAIKRSAGVTDVFVNGTKLTPVVQVTDTTSLTLSSITWGFSATYYPKMKVNEICAFQSALSDAELATLTTL